jgi:hypothetical protein
MQTKSLVPAACLSVGGLLFLTGFLCFSSLWFLIVHSQVGPVGSKMWWYGFVFLTSASTGFSCLGIVLILGALKKAPMQTLILLAGFGALTSVPFMYAITTASLP